VKIDWSDNAIKHLIAIHDYIAKDSTLYAQRMVDRLTRCSQQLAVFPMSGRMVPEYGLKEIREIVERPYRIIYRLWPDRVEILAVIHGAQLLPFEL
jgi:plasmid stabilization system protein ParE